MRMRRSLRQADLKVRLYVILAALVLAAAACSRADSPESAAPVTAAPVTERKYLLERVDDAAVVQLYADGFAALPLREKTLIWHLYQAALAGRDIFIDQKHRNALEMRGVLEADRHAPAGHRSGDARARSSATRSCSGSTTARTTT